jgi:histidinol dehydrogenase
VATVTRGDLQSLQEAARTLARMEGLTAHANAVEVRLRDD